MSISKSYTAHLQGLTAEVITAEVDISQGLNSFSIVGLGDRSIDEARDRISAGIKNTGYTSPKQKNQRVIISLAPADIRKEGPIFDLSMAITYLSAAGDISFDPKNKIFLGELSLEGMVCKVNGVLPILCQAPGLGFTEAFIPAGNAREASLAEGVAIYAVSSLRQIIDHLTGKIVLDKIEPRKGDMKKDPKNNIDIGTIRGNEIAKRGLEITAAGAHNLLMWGPPGTGKTMLAQSLPSILPALSYEQSVEVTGIYSAARMLREDMISHPPFRSPHHTASYPAVVGGGNIPRPGEITLAHRGVLFLDELPEFDREVIEALRQPLEEKAITISRARGIVTFPAQCILIASMNPCPCGKGREGGYICPPHIVASYKRRISGPIMDRIDIYIRIEKVEYEKLAARSVSEETSEIIRARVIRARGYQLARFKRHGISKYYNSEMNARDIETCVEMEPAARSLLALSAEKYQLSGRAFHRVIKVARTIADLEGEGEIKQKHLMEALEYRQKLD